VKVFKGSVSACAALLWFPTPAGLQDSEPGVGFGGFGAVTWARRRCRRLSRVHCPRKTGPTGRAVKETSTGLVRPAASGEDTVLRALTAGIGG
jgi:hypothetical protein